MKRIGFDARVFSEAHPGAGIAHAAKELLEALQEQASFFDAAPARFRSSAP
jgi:hypothetical protein